MKKLITMIFALVLACAMLWGCAPAAPSAAVSGVPTEAPMVTPTVTSTVVPSVSVSPTPTSTPGIICVLPTPPIPPTPTPTPTTTPLPVTERTDMLKGTAVRFTLNKPEREIYDPEMKSTDTIVSIAWDRDDLKAIYAECYDYNIRNDGNQVDRALAAYDETFFNQKAVIVVRLYRDASKANIEYSLAKADGELSIGIGTRPVPEGVATPAIMCYLNTFMEVNKADIGDMTTLSYCVYDIE